MGPAISRMKASLAIVLSILMFGATVAISQVCPPGMPDVVVVGGYYPVQWTAPFPNYWQGDNPFSPTLPDYDGAADYAANPGSFIKVTTLKNPAASIKIGKNMPGHIAARHLYNSPGNGSKFSQKYSEPVHLMSLISYTVTQAVPHVDPNNMRVLRYTASIPDTIGVSYGVPTSLVTVYVYNTGQYESGMPVYVVTNMHPGDRQ